MKYYVYKITNNINGKIYIGYHRSMNINKDSYLGSGVLIKKAVLKYGKKNFTREILFEYDTQQEALDKEKEIVDKNFVNDRNNYNRHTGGNSGWGIEPFNKNKIAVYSPIEDKVYYTTEKKLQKFLEMGCILGNNKKGKRCVIKDNIIKEITKDEIDQYIKDGWDLYNTTQDKIVITSNDKNKTLKYIDSNDLEIYLKNGYTLGNQKSGINKGRIYINNGSNNKRIFEGDLERYQNDGWIKGMKMTVPKHKKMYHLETNILRHIPLDEIEKYLIQGWILGINYKPTGKKKNVL